MILRMAPVTQMMPQMGIGVMVRIEGVVFWNKTPPLVSPGDIMGVYVKKMQFWATCELHPTSRRECPWCIRRNTAMCNKRVPIVFQYVILHFFYSPYQTDICHEEGTFIRPINLTTPPWYVYTSVCSRLQMQDQDNS